MFWKFYILVILIPEYFQVKCFQGCLFIFGNLGFDFPRFWKCHRHYNARVFKFFFNWNIVDLQCCISFGVQHIDSVINTHIYIYIYIPFFRLFSVIGYYRYWKRFHVLYSRSLWVICVTHSSVYLLFPDS